MRALRGIAVVLALGMPLSLFAQTADICSVTRSLSRGMSGADVMVLQAFLRDQGTFAAEPTGFFGSITEAALIDFQIGKGIISIRSEGGVFGPRTRAYVAEHFCGVGSGSTSTQEEDAYSWVPRGVAVPQTSPDSGANHYIEQLQKQVAELHARVIEMKRCNVGTRTLEDGESYLPTIERGDCPIETRSDASKCGRITYQCKAGKLIELVAGTSHVVGGGCRASGQSFNHGDTKTIGSRMIICRNNEWYDLRGTKACSLGDAQVAREIGC